MNLTNFPSSTMTAGTMTAGTVINDKSDNKDKTDNKEAGLSSTRTKEQLIADTEAYIKNNFTEVEWDSVIKAPKKLFKGNIGKDLLRDAIYYCSNPIGKKVNNISGRTFNKFNEECQTVLKKNNEDIFALKIEGTYVKRGRLKNSFYIEMTGSEVNTFFDRMVTSHSANLEANKKADEEIRKQARADAIKERDRLNKFINGSV